MSHTLVNDPRDAVFESIDGYLLTRPDLTRLDAYPGTKVVLRRRLPSHCVALISGGGAGHEPAHISYIGAGMLSACVCGDVFASPHVRAISHAIQAAAGDAGALLIVKNYTGDRLAFGLAAGMARSRGLRVETVYVADDAAVDGGPVTGRRGIAGTVLVHKIAGALAEAGAELHTVAAAARWVAEHVVSMGASLSVCHVPGVKPSDRLSNGVVMELGLGIHGEPGAQQVDRLMTSDETVAQLWASITQRAAYLLGLEPDAPAHEIPVVVLVNNLGGLSNLEMGVVLNSLAKCVRNQPPAIKFVPERIIVGTVMTSLDMRGVSLTILPLRAAAADAHFETYPVVDGFMTLLDAVDTPTACTAFPPAISADVLRGGLSLAPPPALGTPPAVSHETAPSPSPQWYQPILAACAAVESAVDALNAADTVAGDGDCGSTMRTIAAAVRSGLAAALQNGSIVSLRQPSAVELAAALRSAADEIAAAAGGTSGIIYAMMLHTFSTSLEAAARAPSSSALTPRHALLLSIAQACAETVQNTSAVTGATSGCRTMMDVLIPASDALQREAAKGASIVTAAEAAAYAAEVGAEQTKSMPALAGRAAYVSAETLRGHFDPGALAASTWIRAIASSVAAL